MAGGGTPTGPGRFFYPPTVLTDVPPDAALLHEEPFGPVAPVSGFDDIDEALEVANSLPYGLAAYGFTESAATAERLIAASRPGILSINHCGGSVPQAPSGGVKDSGYGREGGHEGLDGYLVTKRVSHKLRHDLVPLRRRRAAALRAGRGGRGHRSAAARAASTQHRPPLHRADLRLLPPAVPGTFFCAGLNYKGHAERAVARATGRRAHPAGDRVPREQRADRAR